MIDFLSAPRPRMPEGLCAVRHGAGLVRGSLDLAEPFSWVAIGDVSASLVEALAFSQSAASGAAVLLPTRVSYPVSPPST